MKKKEIGLVTASERDKIKAIYERRNGLIELAKIICTDNPALYERMITDMAETNASFQDWWNRMALKYDWENIDGGNWEIDFSTCKIYLVLP